MYILFDIMFQSPHFNFLAQKHDTTRLDKDGLTFIRLTEDIVILCKSDVMSQNS